MPSILGDDNNDENDKSQYLIKPEADVHYVNQSGDSMTGDLNMSSNKITNLKYPENETDAANKKYADRHKDKFRKTLI